MVGRIRQTKGLPIGKEDGLIAAQRGEYVIKKSSVGKLGTKVLDHINKHGSLPNGKTKARKRR